MTFISYDRLRDHSLDQGTRTSDFATSRAQFMNDWTTGLRVRFLKNTISAEIRGPGDFSGRTLKAAWCALNAATDIGRILTAIGLVIAAPVILPTIGLQSSTDLLIRYGRWPLLALLLLLGLAVVYRYAPSRRSQKWRWISVGSVVATITWMIGSGLLSYYLANFGNYDATYGSLGAAIALMIWMWMSTIVVLFGAELNSEIEHQTTADSTDGVEKPLGSRGAEMADTVGVSR